MNALQANTLNTPPGSIAASPFALDRPQHYRRWRDWKLAAYPQRAQDLIVEVADPCRLSAGESAALLAVCRKANMAVYAGPAGRPDKTIPQELGRAFGLTRLDSNLLADEDSISSLQVVPGKSGRGYIPYSNQRLLWHTDGYYNGCDSRIRAFVLHCVAPAAEGGDNQLLDHEVAYILLRERDPEHVRALMAPDAMTVPANTEPGASARPAQTGPVFALDAAGNLHMRYTARTRSIVWKDDPATAAAVCALETILADGSAYVFRHRLAAGQGLVCNNALHNRSAFHDGPDAARLLYRARYYDRIAGTDLNDIFRP